MADTHSSASRLDRQPVTVDFIENRLPSHHPAFVNPPLHYDSVSRQYVPNNQALVPRPNHGELAQVDSSGSPAADSNGLSPRLTWDDTKAMLYWNGVFSEAMGKLKSSKEEPKGRSNTAYSIREKGDWDAVVDQLEAARNEYKEAGGRLGWLRTKRRKIADNIDPIAGVARVASNLAPNTVYTTPVLKAVEVILDAVKTAARVRQQVLEGFDDLIPIFSDAELFLMTFSGDKNIRDTSINLAMATLDGIEQAVSFFIRNEFLKGGKAIFTGSDYEKNLLSSLDTINIKSKRLLEEATKSHIYEAHTFSQETQKYLKQLLESQQKIVNGYNSIESLLADYVAKKDRELEAAQQELIRLRVENVILRSNSPLQQSPWPPQPQIQAPSIRWFIDQETLRRMLAIRDVDFTDLAFIAEKKEQLPANQRTQAEQIINTALFQSWIMSTSSAKLLVHWDVPLPKTIAGISPLSVFCTSMARALRAKDRFLSALWFCGRHIDVDEAGAYVGAGAMLASLIDQLLRQYAFDTQLLHREINIESVQRGQLEELIRLLEWLVRRLPQSLTLFFIVDGIFLFERDEFSSEAFQVFPTLLRLASDPSVSTTIKVLFTSTPGTEIVRIAFEEENLILNINGLPRLGWAPNEERMTRELEGELA
ncbi:hypothetical protein F5884DRAFT_875629 [Xylogone sp. PMI_703]|nr:hypothetical protein F5884DRAFT_875629 [Xylogone sp. PMI_703]